MKLFNEKKLRGNRNNTAIFQMNKLVKKTALLLMILAFMQCCKIDKTSELFYNKESELYFRQAQDYENKGLLDSALVYFDKADQSAPNTAIILHERGILKSHMGKYEDALVDLDKSIELTTDQRHKEARFCNRALIYMEMGEMAEACNDWGKSGKLGKNYMKKYCISKE